MWRAARANEKRLKEGMKKLYQAIVDEANKPKISHLPKDWWNRVFKTPT